MLAVAILAIITVVVADFTNTTVGSALASETLAEREGSYNGMRRLIEFQLGAIPSREAGSFLGINLRSKEGRRDMLQLVCPAGNALLSPDAKGFYQITLGVRENPRGSGKYWLGMQREPWTDDDDDDDDDDEGSNAKPVNRADTKNSPKQSLPSDWIPLMAGVSNLELAYFDARLNGWVDKWTDQGALPNLVRLRLSTANEQAPYEVVARVPNGGPRNAITAPVSVPLTPAAGSAGGAGGALPVQRPVGQTGNPAGPVQPTGRRTFTPY